MTRRLLPFPAAALVLLVLIAASIRILLDLQVNNSISNYFPPTDEAVVIDAAVRERFPQDQVLVALFTGDDLFSDTFLAGLDRVAGQTALHPLVERVLGVTNIDRISGTADEFTVEPLLGLDATRDMTVDERRTRVLEDRFAPGILVSKDGTAMTLIVRPRGLDDSLDAVELEDHLRDAITDAGLEPWLYGITGNVALDAAQLRSMLRDTLIFVPATTILGLLLIWWMFRREMMLVVTAVALLAISAATVALLVLADRPYTLVTATLPPLMTALAIALLIHFFSAWRRFAARGLEAAPAIRAALDEIRRPARYTTLTTAAGLASLGLSPVRPISAFGLVAGAGCFILYFVCLVLVPPLLVRLDRKPWKFRAARGAWLDRMVSVLARVAIRRAGPIVIVTAIGCAVGLVPMLEVSVETDMYRFFDDDHELTRTTREIEQHVSGVMPVEVVITAPSRDALKDPRRLRIIKQIQSWLDEHPSVGRVTSMVDVIEEMNWGFHAERPEFRTLPDDEELVSQYLFIYDGRDLYDYVDRDFQHARIPAVLNVRGAFQIRWVMDGLRDQLGQMDLGDLQWEIAGIGRMFSDHEKLLVRGQIYSLFAVVVMLFGFFLFLWRSVGETVLTLIPNMAPILLIFVVMGVFGIWLDTATAVVASVAVGIAVDDTIHMFHGYKVYRAEGRHPVAALMRTYRRAGRAVVATTAILSGQFALLMFSAFEPTVHFGLLTATGLIAAMMFDVLLLPAVIVVAVRLWPERFKATAPTPALPTTRGVGLEPGRVLELESDATLFQQGDVDGYAYFLLEGAVELIADGQVVVTLRAGDRGARQPLAHARPRPVSVRCIEPVAALRLPASMLQLPRPGPQPTPAPVSTPAAEADGWAEAALRGELFRRLPAQDAEGVLAAFTPMPMAAHDIVIEQGDTGEAYYVVREGTCLVLRLRAEGEEPFLLAELEPGESFGEQSLITGLPCNARVAMLTDGVLMRLPKADFLERVRPSFVQPVSLEEGGELAAMGAIWLDVRDQPSDAEIAGSLSMPMQVLRMRMGRLRRDLSYVTWCDNPEEAACAAFVLAVAGFDVSYLDGAPPTREVTLPLSVVDGGDEATSADAAPDSGTTASELGPHVERSGADADAVEAGFETESPPGADADAGGRQQAPESVPPVPAQDAAVTAPTWQWEVERPHGVEPLPTIQRPRLIDPEINLGLPDYPEDIRLPDPTAPEPTAAPSGPPSPSSALAPRPAPEAEAEAEAEATDSDPVRTADDTPKRVMSKDQIEALKRQRAELQARLAAERDRTDDDAP